MSDMNYIDLFSGIGGFALGARWAGMEFKHHFNSDIDDYANKVYAKHFPESIQLGDITKIKTEDLPHGEYIISGGFPCQDISCAGKREGITGSRSGLWFEYWRLIRDLRPRFAIMENVAALTIRGLDAVLGSLAEIGYNAEWNTTRACQLGLPHNRRRVWIVAYPEQISFNFSMEECRILDGFRCSRKWGESWEQFELDNYKVAPSKWRRKGQFNSRPLLLRNDDGIPGRLDRLGALGNAIVPKYSEILFTRIKYILESEHRTCEHNDKVSNFT